MTIKELPLMLMKMIPPGARKYFRALNLLAKSIDTRYYQTLWDFACNTVYGFQSLHIYELDKQYLLDELEELGHITNNEKTFERLKKQIRSEYNQEANLNRKG